MYKNRMKIKQKFSISVPRACYISEAFAKFSKMIQPDNPAELFYNKTDAIHVIKNILKNDYSLGTIRYEDLKPYVEITHADPFLPSMSASATKKQSLLMTLKRGYLFLNVQVSLICCLKIPILLCGYLLQHKSSLNAMDWFRENALITAGFTRTCLFTVRIIILPILTDFL